MHSDEVVADLILRIMDSIGVDQIRVEDFHVGDYVLVAFRDEATGQSVYRRRLNLPVIDGEVVETSALGS